MTAGTRITLADLVCYLRQRLVEARDKQDQAGLTTLLGTLDLLRDAAWDKGDESFASILQDMIDSVQDSLMGVGWKSNIPSEEFIVATLL
jgi:hypothetical protein